MSVEIGVLTDTQGPAPTAEWNSYKTRLGQFGLGSLAIIFGSATLVSGLIQLGFFAPPGERPTGMLNRSVSLVPASPQEQDLSQERSGGAICVGLGTSSILVGIALVTKVTASLLCPSREEA